MIEKPYGKSLREKGVRVGHVPGGAKVMKTGPAKKEPGYWEKTKVTETRPGGGEVPLLDSNLKPINLKKYSDNRPRYEAARRRQRGE